MSDPLTIALSAIAGFILGIAFFGGLWWTVRRAVISPRPALWFFGSLFFRMGIAIAGIYYIGSSDWKKMLACLAGFIIARLTVTWLTKDSSRTTKEANHAS